jgi:purine catabolism regulator
MAREYATLAARREIELNVLDEVLDGALRSEVTLLQQAKRLGHDLHANHVVFVARLESLGTTSIARSHENRWPVFDEVMSRRGPRLLWRMRGTNTEILWPVEDETDAKTIAATLLDDLQRRLDRGDVVVSLGVGRVASGLAGIQQSHQEAKHALSMARRLNGGGGVTRFADLGVYRLIFAAEQLSELRSFHDEALNPVIDYDRQHSADLVRTLRAFFDAKCGPKEAASMLEVHRNTVLYRLERIQEITGLDLDDADVRLRMHLAVCVHTALYSA